MMPWTVKLRVEMTVSVDSGNQESADEYAIARVRDFLGLIDKNASVQLADELTDTAKVRTAVDHISCGLSYLKGI
jgi:hypothetical protein